MGFMPNRANIVALAVAAATTLVAPVRAQEANDNGAPQTTAPANSGATGLGGFFRGLGEALSGAAGQIKQGVELGIKQGLGHNNQAPGSTSTAPYLPPGGTAPGQSMSFKPANGGKTAVYDIGADGSIFVTGISNYSMDGKNGKAGSHLCTIFAKVDSYDQSKGLPRDGSFRPDVKLVVDTNKGGEALWTRDGMSAQVATVKCEELVVGYRQAALAALRQPAADGTAPAAAKKRPKKKAAPDGNNPS